MKADLKVIAQEIKDLKSKRKELRGYVPGLYDAQQLFRSGHIAYCMLRGRTLEQIEPKLRDPNGFNHAYVRKQAVKIIDSVNNNTFVEIKSGTKDIRTSGQTPVAVATSSSIWSRITKFLV
jgi:hypothetical protein